MNYFWRFEILEFGLLNFFSELSLIFFVLLILVVIIFIFLCLYIMWNPWMAGNFTQIHSISGVFDQQSWDQISCSFRNKGWELQINPRDPSVGSSVPLSLKRWVSNQEFEEEDPKRPDIHLLVMLPPFYHFRWEIVQGATQSNSSWGGGMDRPTKISNLQLTLFSIEEG